MTYSAYMEVRIYICTSGWFVFLKDTAFSTSTQWPPLPKKGSMGEAMTRVNSVGACQLTLDLRWALARAQLDYSSTSSV